MEGTTRRVGVSNDALSSEEAAVRREGRRCPSADPTRQRRDYGRRNDADEGQAGVETVDDNGAKKRHDTHTRLQPHTHTTHTPAATHTHTTHMQPHIPHTHAATHTHTHTCSHTHTPHTCSHTHHTHMQPYTHMIERLMMMMMMRLIVWFMITAIMVATTLWM